MKIVWIGFEVCVPFRDLYPVLYCSCLVKSSKKDNKKKIKSIVASKCNFKAQRRIFHSDFLRSNHFVLTTKCIKQRIETTDMEHSKVFDVSYSNFGENTLQTNR